MNTYHIYLKDDRNLPVVIRSQYYVVSPEHGEYFFKNEEQRTPVASFPRENVLYVELVTE